MLLIAFVFAYFIKQPILSFGHFFFSSTDLDFLLKALMLKNAIIILINIDLYFASSYLSLIFICIGQR